MTYLTGAGLTAFGTHEGQSTLDLMSEAAPGQGAQNGRSKYCVYAASLVHRAPTPEARAHVPYAILLVDMAEGFRMMAHGTSDLAIGDPVWVGYKPFAGAQVPFFKRES